MRHMISPSQRYRIRVSLRFQDKTRTRVFQHCERVGVWHAKPKAHVWQGDLLLRLVRMLFHRDNHVFFTGFGRRLQAIRLGSSQNLFQNVR